MSERAFRDPFKAALANHLPEHHAGEWYPRGPMPNWSTSTLTVYHHGEYAFTFMIHDTVTPETLHAIGRALLDTGDTCLLCHDTGSIDVSEQWGMPMSIRCNCGRAEHQEG